MEIKNRIEWVDALKGIGIAAMVVGHQCHFELLVRLIFSFHMPLFFIVSGYLLNVDKYEGKNSFFKARSKRLLGPYAFGWGLAVLMILITAQVDEPMAILDATASQALGMLYGIGTKNTYEPLSHIGASFLWFLPAMFIADIIFFYSAIFLKKNIKLLMLLSLTYSAIGIFIGKYIFLPWSIDIALAVQIFVFAGYAMRNSDPGKNLLTINGLKSYLFLIALSIIWIFDIYSGGISINNRLYFVPLVSFLGALSAVILLIHILKNIRFKIPGNTLQFLGYNSLVIYVFQRPIALLIPPYSILNQQWILQSFYLIGLSLLFSNMFKKSMAFNKIFFK